MTPACSSEQAPLGPKVRTQEDFQGGAGFITQDLPGPTFQTQQDFRSGSCSVTQDRLSSQGSSGTVVPDTPHGSADIEMSEMELLSQVLGRVELAGHPILQHHFLQIQKLIGSR